MLPVRPSNRAEPAEHMRAMHPVEDRHHRRVVQAVFDSVLQQMRALLAAADLMDQGDTRVPPTARSVSEACQGPQQAASGGRRLRVDRAAFQATQGQSFRAEGRERCPSPADHRHRVPDRQPDM